MQQTATAASFQMTQHLKLFLCIDMLVWLESFRPFTSAETYVLHLVMLFRLYEIVQRCAIGIGHVDIINVT